MSISRMFIIPVVAAGALALAGCGSSDPLGDGETTGATTASGGERIVVGSQQYYSNEIIAEVYAQALEAQGFEVDRQFQIGQREVYLPELESGVIDILPEYSGNLLQYYDSATTATSPEEVIAALGEALPEGLRVLEPSTAADQDSFNVTAAFAEEWGLESVGDLAGVDVPIVVGANSEFETRPYGPAGLSEVYGVEASVLPIEDSGGPLTVKALQDGTVNVANIYSADPSIQANGFVTLDDPEALVLPQQVVPLVSDRVDEEIAAVLNEVSAVLTTEDLVAMNARSVEEQLASDVIARDWLAETGLVS
jgi:osmoprotectant transport system substrate-binding protein